MTWLLWKDYRHNRLIVFAGIILLLLPYVFGFWMVLNSEASRHPGGWAFVIAVASLYSLGLGQVTLTLFGGNAIAGERVDRSAEFLACLPITRRKILASKLLLALMITAVIWATLIVAPEVGTSCCGALIVAPEVGTSCCGALPRPKAAACFQLCRALK